MATGYLTPNSFPADTICRVLFIPNARDWLSLVTGALEQLTFPDNFMLFGAVTPAGAAERFSEMFDDFCFRRGQCRVVGEIVVLAGVTNPDPVRWLPCDGASLLRSDYPDLYAEIGAIYGSADNLHFNLPDMRGRVPMGVGSGPGLTPRALGDAVGEELHTLTVAESPSHGHADSGHTHAEGIAAPSLGAALLGVPIPSAIPALGSTAPGFAALSSSGLDGAHNNIQPSLALNYYIVALD